jgi:hypothetical protein
VIVIRTKLVAGAKLYWRLDGSIVVRVSPEGHRQHNLAGCLLGRMARVIAGASAQRARDVWIAGLVAIGALVGGEYAVLVLGHRNDRWARAGVCLLLWTAAILLVAALSERLAREKQWCRYWWEARDYWVDGGERTRAAAEVLAQGVDLGEAERTKVLGWLTGEGFEVTANHRAESTGWEWSRWGEYKDTWREVRRGKVLERTVVDMAVAIWEPGSDDELASLGVALEAAGHVVRTSVG